MLIELIDYNKITKVHILCAKKKGLAKTFAKLVAYGPDFSPHPVLKLPKRVDFVFAPISTSILGHFKYSPR